MLNISNNLYIFTNQTTQHAERTSRLVNYSIAIRRGCSPVMFFLSSFYSRINIEFAITAVQIFTYFYRYFKHHNVQPAKTAFDVYKIPHVTILQQCSKIATTLRDKLAKEPSTKKRKIRNSPDSTIEYNCYDIPGRNMFFFHVFKPHGQKLLFPFKFLTLPLACYYRPSQESRQCRCTEMSS